LSEPGVQAAAEDFVASGSRQPGTELDIAAALAELPERYRQVVILFYLEDRAYEEVAAMLGIPVGTVKTLLFRAKKELLRIGSRQARVCRSAASHSVQLEKPTWPRPVTPINCALLKPTPS
jgi:RNA polymerase sigma-70 factor (ECF subfamily)